MLQTNYIKIEQSVTEITIQEVFQKYFNEIFPKIKQLIQERWKKGITPNGDKIGLYSWYSYALFKQEINPLADFGTVDLTLTGELARQITFVTMSENQYEIFSKDEKYNKIIQKYGDVNFNISENERDIVIKELTKKVVNEILNSAYYG